MNFENQVVVVTGAARGLGRAYARQFARRGAGVVVCDVRGCDETRAAVEAEGAECLALETDVTSADSTAALELSSVSSDS